MKKFLLHPDTIHAIAFALALTVIINIAQETSVLLALMTSASIGFAYIAGFAKGYMEGLEKGAKKTVDTITRIINKVINDMA